jgi:hypothetical protein
MNQPWRCLWRGSVQITLTTPLRLTILQLRHIFLTDARTFIFLTLLLKYDSFIDFYYLQCQPNACNRQDEPFS